MWEFKIRTDTWHARSAIFFPEQQPEVCILPLRAEISSGIETLSYNIIGDEADISRGAFDG